jgi:uncharacterized protein with GYD domain
MTIYVMLGNLKSSAFEKFDNIEERDKKAKKIVESLGGKMISLFYTFGRYDFVVIIDMPSKESLVKFFRFSQSSGPSGLRPWKPFPRILCIKLQKKSD